MKLFDYECAACGVFELWGNTDTKRSCPNCGQRLVRLISAPAVVLDGTDPGLPRAWRRWADHHERAGDGPLSVR